MPNTTKTNPLMTTNFTHSWTWEKFNYSVEIEDGENNTLDSGF